MRKNIIVSCSMSNTTLQFNTNDERSTDHQQNWKPGWICRSLHQITFEIVGKGNVKGEKTWKCSHNFTISTEYHLYSVFIFIASLEDLLRRFIKKDCSFSTEVKHSRKFEESFWKLSTFQLVAVSGQRNYKHFLYGK